MNINRNNYETFFLLYIDNELSTVERVAVEVFVKANPDLAHELNLLLDTCLQDVSLPFKQRQDLYREEPVLEQEQLLNYLDQELDKQSMQQLEIRLKQSASLTRELELLQLTKLDASEKLIFPQKEALYRSSGARLFSLRFQRVAAIAAILLVLMFAGIFILQKNDNQSKDLADKSAVNNTTNDVIKKSFPTNKVTITDESQAAEKIEALNLPVEHIANHTENKNNEANNKLVVVKPITESKKIETDELQQSVVLENNPQVNQIIEENQQNHELKTASIESSDELIASNKLKNSEQTLDSKPANMEPLTTVSSNQILYINENLIARSKVGGIVRKVKRIIDRNTPVITENSIRLAGYEIARNK